METGTLALRNWLRGSDSYDVLDYAEMGCLPMSLVQEIVEDFDVSVMTFRQELAAALQS